jgi:hypothetical protein
MRPDMGIIGRRAFGLLLTVLLCAATTGCGPGFRFRSPETLPRGDVEVGVGLGAAGRTAPADFGGMELQAGLRGGISDHVEMGGTFWTYSFATYGGALDFRIQPVKRPVAFSIDFGGLAAICCGAGNDQRALALGGGFDVGFTFGGRIGGDLGPAPYIAPHFEMTWTLPAENDWPAQLFFPIGVDIPLGTTALHLRPELLVAVLIFDEIAPEVRVGGGIAVAIQGPGFAKMARMKKEAREQDAPDDGAE